MPAGAAVAEEQAAGSADPTDPAAVGQAGAAATAGATRSAPAPP
nr:hypothetical protein [Mycobacterium tuberculosis]